MKLSRRGRCVCKVEANRHDERLAEPASLVAKRAGAALMMDGWMVGWSSLVWTAIQLDTGESTPPQV